MQRKNKLAIIASTAFFTAAFTSVGSYVALSNKAVSIQAESVQGEAPSNQSDSLPEGDSTEGDLPLYEPFEATAYCDFGITYSGVLVHRGIVAADPKVLPIGSVIQVKAGDYSGIYTVMDTGGVVKGHIIDIYMPDYEEAIQFGRQNVGVHILRRGWHPGQAMEFEYTVAG